MLLRGERQAGRGVSLLLNGDPQNPGRRAAVGLALSAETPGDLVVRGRPHDRPVALIAMTLTSAACGAPTTVVIGDDVVAVVGRIQARTDPRNRRHLCARRTGIHGSPAATAQRAVYGAVTPVIATGRITRILWISRALGRPLSICGARRSGGTFAVSTARNRQQRHRCRPDQQPAQHPEESSAGTAPCH